MNYYIYFSRVLRYAASWIQANFIEYVTVEKSALGQHFLRFIVYSILYKFARKIKGMGERKYLDVSSPGSMSREMDEYMFRKLVLYVEGYLATIAHRITDAPKAMPPDRETRAKWGRAALRDLATKSDSRYVTSENPERERERRKGWNEIRKIYNWYTEEREDWNDPYMEEVEVDCSGRGLPDLDERSKRYADKSMRYRNIRQERRTGRVQRLFDRRHLLTYD